MSFETLTVDPLLFFTPRRLDLIVKYWLFYYWHCGKSGVVESIYLEHIAQRVGAQLPLDRYLPKACRLFESMHERGYSGEPVPVNKDFQLLDGAHRVACGAALGINITINKFPTDHIWPPWDAEWFVEHGMSSVLPSIENTLAELRPGTPPHAKDVGLVCLKEGDEAGARLT